MTRLGRARGGVSRPGPRTAIAAISAAALLLLSVAAPGLTPDRALRSGAGVAAAAGSRPAGPIPNDAFRAVEVGSNQREVILDPPRTSIAASVAAPEGAERPGVEAALESKPATSTPAGGGDARASSGGGDAAGSIPATGWRWPLIGPITQRFGGGHLGIDIDGDTGDVAVAAHAGTVVGAGYLTECGGLQVHVQVDIGVEAWYQHLSATLVSVGQQISAGTPIGRVGASGCAQGSHLHFGIRRGTTFVNPLPFLPAR